MLPEDQIERKRSRALTGLVIGLMLGMFVSAGSYGSVNTSEWVSQTLGALIVAPIIFALIAGGPKGFAAIFRNL